MAERYTFTCNCCGKTYDDMPLCFGTAYPYFYFSVKEHEIEKRVELTESLCVIDEEHFFHQGRIIIPIVDHHEDLIFNVWTTISRDNFELRNEVWNDPGRVNRAPYFGWLQTIVPTYGDTINIKTIAKENEVGIIPTIEIIEDLHPLLFDQTNGITFKEAKHKVQQILSQYHKE